MSKPIDKIVDILYKKKQGLTLSAGEEMYYQAWEKHQANHRQKGEALEEVIRMLQYIEEEKSSRVSFLERLRASALQEKEAMRRQEAEQVLQRAAAAKKARIIRMCKIAAAAIVLTVVVEMALYWMPRRLNHQEGSTGIAARTQPAITVSLTMSNGKRIVIHPSMQDIVTEEGYKISFKKELLSYTLVNSKVPKKQQALNTLEVPAGNQLRVLLPDGSMAWLNAVSSLTYTLIPNTPVRNMWLTGEGSFEVKKDPARPFIVHAGSVQVEAIGTKFNVAQKDSSPSQVTLQEGIIKIRSKKGFTIVRQPQVWLAGDDVLEIKTRSADTTKQLMDEVAARQRGLLYFYAATLADIVPVLERMYGLQLDDRSILSLPDKFHIDSLPVTAPFERFAKALEGSKVLKVTVQGHTLHIEKRK